MIAWYFLNESFRKQDYVGYGLAIVGPCPLRCRYRRKRAARCAAQTCDVVVATRDVAFATHNVAVAPCDVAVATGGFIIVYFAPNSADEFTIEMFKDYLRSGSTRAHTHGRDFLRRRLIAATCP